MTVLTVYAVFADAEEAERIAEAVESEQLAACANILSPCHSSKRFTKADTPVRSSGRGRQ